MKLLRPKQNLSIIETDKVIVMFSYSVPVAANIGGKFYRTAKHWSQTTSKHINQWLAGAKAQEKPQEFFDTLLGEA